MVGRWCAGRHCRRRVELRNVVDVHLENLLKVGWCLSDNRASLTGGGSPTEQYERQMADEQPLRSHVLAALYRIYERRLARQVQAQPVPRHVGVILDGTRRYGRQRQMTAPEEVYAVGANKLDDLLNWCVELGIPAVTLWVLSTDNLARA